MMVSILRGTLSLTPYIKRVNKVCPMTGKVITMGAPEDDDV
jgi:hypothetical protein